MSEVSSLYEFEKKSVFYINFALIIFVILIFLFDLPLRIFFYSNLIITFILSYLFFKKSKKLSKALILTNLFIFFYFLYPTVSSFLTEIFDTNSYLFILLYVLFLAYIFLVFSGENKTFLGNIRKTSSKMLGIVFLIGIVMGFMFYFVREPVPISLFDPNQGNFLLNIIFFTAILSLAEQMMFSGFLFNSYKHLSSRIDAFYQVSIVFVLFHILRFEVLVKNYFINFPDSYIVYVTFYYIFLFLFMITALYLYSFKSKKYEGNFLYPVSLHFFVDCTVFILVWMFGI